MTAGKKNGNKRGMVHHGRSGLMRSSFFFFFSNFLIDWFGLENGEWRMENGELLIVTGLHYTLLFVCLAGEESREYTIRLAFLAFYFLLGWGFLCLRGFIPRPLFFFFFLKIFYSVLYIYIFLHIASLALQFTFLFVSFLGVLLLFHRSGQIVVVNQM